MKADPTPPEDQSAVARALASLADEGLRQADGVFDTDEEASYLRVAAIAGLAQTAALLAINDTLAQIRDQIAVGLMDITNQIHRQGPNG